MTCEEARRILVTAPDPQALAHLEQCPTCFAALEDDDPVVGLLRAARPDAVPVPPAIAARILSSWNGARLSWRLGIVCAAGLTVLMAGLTAGAALAVWTTPDPAGSMILQAGRILGALAALGLAILAAPRALLLLNPVVLAGYAVLTVVVCAFWISLYQRVHAQRSRITR